MYLKPRPNKLAAICGICFVLTVGTGSVSPKIRKTTLEGFAGSNNDFQPPIATTRPAVLSPHVPEVETWGEHPDILSGVLDSGVLGLDHAHGFGKRPRQPDQISASTAHQVGVNGPQSLEPLPRGSGATAIPSLSNDLTGAGFIENARGSGTRGNEVAHDYLKDPYLFGDVFDDEMHWMIKGTTWFDPTQEIVGLTSSSRHAGPQTEIEGFNTQGTHQGSLNEPIMGLEVRENSPKIYAWIAWRIEQLSPPERNVLRHVYGDFLSRVDELSRRDQMSKAQSEEIHNGHSTSLVNGGSGSNNKITIPSPFSDTSDIVKELIVRVFLLNRQFVEQFASDSLNHVLEKEQRSLGKWLLGNILTPVEDWLPVSSLASTSSRWDCFHNLLRNYVHIKDNSIAFGLPFFKRAGPNGVLLLSQRDVLLGELTVKLLGSYYKTSNLLKWSVLFGHDDESFLKLIVTIRKRVYNREKITRTRDRAKIWEAYDILPWENPWERGQDESGLLRLHFQRYFWEGSIEGYIQGQLLSPSQLDPQSVHLPRRWALRFDKYRPDFKFPSKE